mmetsp:Transcript_10649/g.36155  ORF Transcript_10649/g.36155 Transcript_10649/m.36155 type:complete len:241 (+) Transcript_10649:65-787(+)
MPPWSGGRTGGLRGWPWPSWPGVWFSGSWPSRRARATGRRPLSQARAAMRGEPRPRARRWPMCPWTRWWPSRGARSVPCPSAGSPPPYSPTHTAPPPSWGPRPGSWPQTCLCAIATTTHRPTAGRRWSAGATSLSGAMGGRPPCGWTRCASRPCPRPRPSSASRPTCAPAGRCSSSGAPPFHSACGAPSSSGALWPWARPARAHSTWHGSRAARRPARRASTRPRRSAPSRRTGSVCCPS